MKLRRARKDSRAQYLKIQALELLDSKEDNLLQVAEVLLHRVLTEYSDYNFNRAPTLHRLGDVYKKKKDYERAIEYYKQALDYEQVYPNVRTDSYLNYAELVVKTGKTSEYQIVENILLKELPKQLFPIDKYKTYSILSIISTQKGNEAEAERFKKLAEENANQMNNGIRYHQFLGLVKLRDSVLDKLTGKGESANK